MTKFINKFSDKQVFFLAILTALVLMMSAYILYTNKTKAKATDSSSVQQAFSELVDYVDSIDATLGKIVVSSGAESVSSLARKLYSEAALAKADLPSIPLSGLASANTSKFFSQLGDYVSFISKKLARGDKLSDDDVQGLSTLSTYSKKLKTTYDGLKDRLYSGDLTVENMNKVLAQELPEPTGDVPESQDMFSDYPSLIYDGPYSDHITQMSPEMTKDAEIVDMTQAAEIASEFVAQYDIAAAEFVNECEGKLPTYGFRIPVNDRGGYAYVTVSKSGGYVVSYMNNKVPKHTNITLADGVKGAQTFLKDNGIHNMRESFYQKQDNILTVNFAYTDGEYTCYPDLIKVEVALDNGEIIGFNQAGYLFNHKQRQLPQEIADIDAITEAINPAAEIASVSKAIIPTPYKSELFCYEVTIKHNDETYLLYYNVETGEQEDVLMLLIDENGVLTI